MKFFVCICLAISGCVGGVIEDDEEELGSGDEGSNGEGSGEEGGEEEEQGSDPVDNPATIWRPRIFYTDLKSGPNSGGENNDGAFVTLYGRNFGALQGTSRVTIGGAAVASYPIWSDSKITVQLGPAAVTGNIVVEVGGSASNGISFVVRSGRIFFVATNGSDSASGSVTSPWRTLPAAKKKVAAGDIIYVRDGVVAKSIDASNAALALTSATNTPAGTSSAPIALVAYPGANVIIGCTESTCGDRGIRMHRSYWVLAGMTVRAKYTMYSSSIEYSANGLRVVANIVPGGSYYGTTAGTNPVRNVKVLGNHIYDHEHSLIYFGGYGENDNIEVAWNIVHDVWDGDGIKFLGHRDYDHATRVTIHDNLVYNTAHPAIWVGGYTDNGHPWMEDALIYNNVVYAGGQNWSDGANGACLRVSTRGPESEPIDVKAFHNTFVNCGRSVRADAFDSLELKNNIFVQTNGKPFLDSTLGNGQLVMSNNLYQGNASVPSKEQRAITGNAGFVDMSARNYRLTTSSAAIDRGLLVGVTSDHDRDLRPVGAAPDLGAYEGD